jgi:hypothetical protein
MKHQKRLDKKLDKPFHEKKGKLPHKDLEKAAGGGGVVPLNPPLGPVNPTSHKLNH